MSLRRRRGQLIRQTHTDLPVSVASEKLMFIHLSTMSVVAEVPSMEMEEMDGRWTGGMSARSWKSAARQELAQSVAAAAASPTCLYNNSLQSKDALDGSSGMESGCSYRNRVSSFPFRMDGSFLVDEGVSCSGSSEVYPEVQRRAGAIAIAGAAGILLANKHGDSYPRCNSAAAIPPELQ